MFPLILLLYPLRHIYVGLDLWDTGYNYANFRYMGLEHMDSMWLFATYLANAVGHLLTFLPGGHTLLFLNLYTGLFISLLAVGAYFFCKDRLHMPAGIVFLGEFVAISLCWCPTALLYNYLTYVLFLAAVFLLYEGLTGNKKLFLVLAGVALGTNVFVRFSNLPQAALILAVWGYGLLCRKKFRKAAQETAFCFAGYAGAICLWLFYLSVRYGFSEYVSGIMRLFAMTDTASDYKATSMVFGMLKEYTDQLYWVIRIGLLLLAGVAAWFVLPKKWIKVKQAVCVLLALGAGTWLYVNQFSPLSFDSYISMLRPAILFLMLTLFVCILRILQKGTGKEEKLLAMMIILQVLLTSLGSNNRLYPSINNLFVAAPYVFFCIYRFFRQKEYFPVKPFALMVSAVFVFQSIGFGACFVFTEAQGAKKVDTKVKNNAILSGIYMSKERAQWMEELSAYVEENGLTGEEVLLYGNIPALSFYLGMPSAFNPWSDLASFSLSAMTEAMEQLEGTPVVILEHRYALYLQEGEAGLMNAGYKEEEIKKITEDAKIALIAAYMEQNGYTERFSNNKFALYEAEKRSYD